MDRITVSLTDEQKEWVEQQATESPDTSRSAVVRRAVDLARGEASMQTGEDHSAGLEQRVRELEETVSGHEQLLTDLHQTGEDTGEGGGEDSVKTGEVSEPLRTRVESAEWDGMYTQKPDRVDAVVHAAETLRERGRLTSGMIRDEIVPKHCDVSDPTRLVKGVIADWEEVSPPETGSNHWLWTD